MVLRRAAFLGLVLGLLSSTPSAFAQSAIAGTAKDTTGAILPGVTVEASSPALIEKTRSVVTDAAGQYKIVDLRPGVYTVTFTLSGFSTNRREGIELAANFTAPVNAEMRVGTISETVTVSGQTPVVDVQSTTRRDVLARDVLDSLPTGRNYQTVGQILPALNSGAGRFDVGGSTAMWQSQLAAYGGRSGDMTLNIDGLSMLTTFASGANPSFYHNDGAFQEMVYQVSGGTADTQTAGVSVNMIPKDGSNVFKGDFTSVFSNTKLQSSNYSDDLRAAGLAAPAELGKQTDLNGGVGGPIEKDRLWFFASIRNQLYDNKVAGVFYANGEQAVDDNRAENYTGRLTYQVTPRNKVTGMYENDPKWRGHRDIETGLVAPEGAGLNVTDNAFFSQGKWTSTISNRLLFDLGFSYLHYNYWIKYEPQVRIATCTVAFASCPAGTNYGDISHIETVGLPGIPANYRSVAATRNFNDYFPKTNISSSLSYVTGSHAIKAGLQWGWGTLESFRETNGDIIQRYRAGVPIQVQIKNTPTFSITNLKADVGVYLQDSWTLKRLTLNPGIRWEWFDNEIPAQSVPVGRFVPARSFPLIPDVPNFKNWAGRFGAAYDLFGNGKTAIKGSVGRYYNQDQTGFAVNYNPVAEVVDTRNWTDLNRDDIAQENEIGPGNTNFATVQQRFKDPDLKRSYQTVSNLTLQRELLPGVSATVAYNRRTFGDIARAYNRLQPVTAYSLVTIPDPRANGQTLPVFNLSPSVLSLVETVDSNSVNTSAYNGVDVGVSGRFRAATLTAGTSTGRTRSNNCDVVNPNALRFCNEAQFDIPWRTTFKLAGTYALPYGVRLGSVFQSVAGAERTILYVVDRTVLPTLVQTSVNVALDPPGSLFSDRVNQVDINIGRTFHNGRTTFSPQFELFNIFNANPVATQTNTYGPSLGRPITVLNPRLVRLGLQIHF